MLIDSELKDLPAEERRRWKSYLAGVETSQIPHVLQKRAEGVVPPELTQPAMVADSKEDLPAIKLSPPLGNESDDDLNAPNPEIQLSSGDQVEEDRDASDSSVANHSSKQHTIKIALEEEGLNDSSKSQSSLEQTTHKQADPEASEKHGTRKMWPPTKRGDRSLTDRISGGRIPPLTPPWSRESHPAEEKSAKPPLKPTSPTEKPAVTAFIEDPVRPDPKSDYWQDELRKLISLMEAEAARPPVDDTPAERQAHIQRQVYLRMLYLMDAEPEKAQLPIADVEVVDQEFWTSMFWGMSNYFDVEQTGDPGTRAAQTIAQLNSAARQLQSVADLELRNVSFSSQIDGWGLYDRFDRDEFEPGQEVLLYGEIRNFSSEATPTGFYRTLVNSTIEIVRAGEEDNVLERNDLGDTEDHCRGLRSDFYNSYRITIPSRLTPGSYQLRLSVEDKLNGRFATQTIGFTVR